MTPTKQSKMASALGTLNSRVATLLVRKDDIERAKRHGDPDVTEEGFAEATLAVRAAIVELDRALHELDKKAKS